DEPVEGRALQVQLPGGVAELERAAGNGGGALLVLDGEAEVGLAGAVEAGEEVARVGARAAGDDPAAAGGEPAGRVVDDEERGRGRAPRAAAVARADADGVDARSEAREVRGERGAADGRRRRVARPRVGVDEVLTRRDPAHAAGRRRRDDDVGADRVRVRVEGRRGDVRRGAVAGVDLPARAVRAPGAVAEGDVPTVRA